ncbi:MAG: adenosylmethionine decarboxylase [Lewinella sp.]|nr:adenosylmethionine decarboxylase [Lewinella sp.]
MTNFQPLGRHILLELYDCPRALLDDQVGLEGQLRQAALAMGATVVTSCFHQFSPYGVSGVVVIQESHLTIHTWPEHGYAAVDIFTCGAIDLDAGVRHLEQALQAGSCQWQLIHRGLDPAGAAAGRGGPGLAPPNPFPDN